MCGFFGIINYNSSQLSLARQALNTLEHRGRDQWGDWNDSDIYLGHRRLSILDLSQLAIQPFVDEDVVVVVNGEIYNHLALRQEIGNKLFKSNSDSEVIMHGYKKWGINLLLKKLDGMYAFALYDRKSRRMILAKDKWGKKPLFYSSLGGRIIFASEIKALFEFESDLRVFSYEGIKHWMAYRGSHNKQTIYDGVFRLEPGSYLEIDHDLSIREHRHYNLIDVALKGNVSDLNSREIVEIVKEKLSTAVEKRLMSDVPLGLQLSGGIDSSLIASILKEKAGSDIHSFSVGFSEKEFESYSEDKYSDFVAMKWGFQHHSFGITKKMVGESFEEVIYLFDGMLDYPNAIPIFLLNQYSKKYISVSLTGEAADELFGGYGKYLQMGYLSKRKILPSLIPEIIFRMQFPDSLNKHYLRPLYLNKKYGGDIKSILTAFNSYISPQTMDHIFGEQTLTLLSDSDFNKLESLSYNRQVLILDHMTYLYSLLDRQDRTSMGANIEARLPFIDQDLVEWVVGLNPDRLFNSKLNKIPLKQISSEIYGDEFTNRRKMGFPLPLNSWLEDLDCFGRSYQKIFDDEFLLYQKIDKTLLMNWLSDGSFSNKLINYSDSEKLWMKWFLMVLRISQDVFKIKGIK